MENTLRLYIQGDSAFVNIGNGYLLCIGTVTEVENADVNQIAQMVKEAIAHSKFRALERSKILH